MSYRRRERKRPPLDERIAASFRSGEPAATEQVRELVARIVAFRGYFIPVDDRDDLVQQAMLDLWQAVCAADAGIRSFEAVLRTVVYRRCVDWVRTRRVATRPVAEDDALDERQPDGDFFQAEQARMGMQILEQVRGPCRELFRLVLWEELSYKRIAELWGRSEGALRVQMCTCLKRAREMAKRMRSEP